MHLKDHLKETGESQSAFGSDLVPPVSQSLMSQWINGVTRVTLSYALQIERKTKGKVTPQDCADMYVETPSARASPSARHPAQQLA